MTDAGIGQGFTVQVMATPEYKVPLEVLAALWKESLNIEIVPDIVENSVYSPRRAAGEFEAYFGGSGGDPDPDDSIDDVFADGSKFNSFGYNDEVVNRLNLRQKAAVDIDQRLEYILELTDRIDETFHGVFTHHNLQTAAYSEDVKGYVWVHAMRQFGPVWLDR